MDDRWMATQAYRDWVADGRPWEDAQPIRDVGDQLTAHGYTVYYHGDDRHLQADTPEDHTPFSVTGWPGAAPYPVCNAMDVMPPAAGQKSAITGRTLPSLAKLGARLRADRSNGVPGTAWVKYMNWEPGDGNCWHESWQPVYAQRTSTDRGHIHVSGRTDYARSGTAAGYDLVARTEGNGMPLYGWDMSHYDAPDARRAPGEGFSFVTHKAGGDEADDEIVEWWNLMKGLRSDEFLVGAYWVLYPGSPVAKADAFIARLDSTCPGWRDAPFILQVDCERWGGNSATMPGVADIRSFCNRLAAVMPKLRPIVYAPEWCYGETLTGLGYPLWASNYVTGSGPASTLYPGDSSTRWHAYSGQTPAVLQFTSSATIAGQTTCDANAYRGTIDQLRALIAPGWEDDMPSADEIAQAVANKLFTDFRNPQSGLAKVRDESEARTAAKITAAATAIGTAVGASEAQLEALLTQLDRAEAERDAAHANAIITAVEQLTGGGPISPEQLQQALRNVFGSLDDD